MGGGRKEDRPSYNLVGRNVVHLFLTRLRYETEEKKIVLCGSMFPLCYSHLRFCLPSIVVGLYGGSFCSFRSGLLTFQKGKESAREFVLKCWFIAM